MQILLTASKDAYITNKIIKNSYRSSNANVGQAATLDLFKLFEESGLESNGQYITENVSEKSVLLIKFDYDKIAELTSSILDIDSNNFKAFLELKDVSSGMQKPYGFNIKCNPLKKNFQEGFGFDTNTFSDYGSCNYLTSSYYGNSPITWNSEGAGTGGATLNGQINVITKATGKITVTDEAGWANNPTFTLRDGTNTVTFSKNDAAETPTRTSATAYTFGTNNIPEFPGGLPIMARRIYDAIVLAKTNDELKITAADPLAPNPDVAYINLTQDDVGPHGNTPITAVNNTNAFTVINFSGGYKEDHLDYITSGSHNGTKVDFGSSFYFNEPNDDLIVDITNVVSASIKGLIANNGLRIGFSGSYDTDTKTRFVKRFGSKHIQNKLLTPKLRIVFDDSYMDNKSNFFLDRNNEIFLKVKRGSSSTNLYNAAGEEVTGISCGKLTVSSGSYSKTVNFDQVDQSSNNIKSKGFYKATLSIPSSDSYIQKALTANNSGFELTAEWKSNDSPAIVFRKEKINVKGLNYGVENETELAVSFMNQKSSYFEDEDINIQVTIKMNRVDYAASKVRKEPDDFFEETHFEIKEMLSNKIVIKRDLNHKSTKMSFYDGSYSSKILASTLRPGFIYVLSLSSFIGNSIYNHPEEFVFKVVEK